MIKRDTLQCGIIQPVRSFAAREGRMTEGQRHTLEKMWSKFGLHLQPAHLDLRQVFGREAPLILEIGFGDGRSLLAMAQENPQVDFIGIEVYRSGIARLFAAMERNKLSNIRVFCADAIEVLTHCIPDDSLHKLQLFFPDPWQKIRHHKRRIVQPEFITLVTRKLQVDGVLHMATDWENYASHMLEVTGLQANLSNVAGENNFAIRPTTRPLTKFEQRGQRLGYGTWDLIFRKSHNI